MTPEQTIIFDYATQRIEGLKDLIAAVESVKDIGTKSLANLNVLRGKQEAFEEILNALKICVDN